jgi:hypothetical protein
MKDRLSIHVDNGQSEIFEAISILRNGGTTAQSGLVGITNKTHTSAEAPVLPETILNVQSSGHSDVRFSSGPSKFYRSSLELISNGNTRASGLHITYDPELDDAFIVPDDGTGYGYDPRVNPGSLDNTVVDFSLIRPSGTEGMEFSWMSVSERGYVAIGQTRAHKDRHYHPNAPLTIAFASDGHADSGTLSMHEQSTAPEDHSAFGKVYVKPYTTGGRTQAIYFKDDGGNETNLILSQDLEPTNSIHGLIWGDEHGNSYGGWHTPCERVSQSDQTRNTYYGWGAGFSIPCTDGASYCNTLIGYLTGSGLESPSVNNTIIGCKNLTDFTSANRNVILGDNNVNGGGGGFGGMDESILIGRDLYFGNVPDDGTLAIGFGGDSTILPGGFTSPLVSGMLIGSNRLFSINDATFSVLDTSDSEFSIRHEFDNPNSRFTTVFDIIDYSQGGSSYGRNNFKFKFSNEDGLANTLFQLDPLGGVMSNSPSYELPATTTPFAQLEGDFKLRGALRFQDGTSLSGISDFELIPIVATSGVAKRVQGSKNYIVLDLSELPLAGTVSSNILASNTYISAQLEGADSNLVGKISLEGLADYVGSGFASVAENCNVLFANPEAEVNINTAVNAATVFIGCDVAQNASGWKNAVIIGANAGTNASTPNPTLTTDTAVVFIGHKAGTNADDISNSIFIGEDAGSEAQGSEKSIFIGPNAGQYTTTNNSIGLGFNALRGSETTSVIEDAENNIEIVAGKLDNQRLMFEQTLSDRLNIQNTIAGRTDSRNISIGDARLTPTAPLEVRRDSIIHASNGNDYVQAWYCDDELVASLDCEGNLVSVGGGEGMFVEGTLAGTLTAGTLTTASTQQLNIYEAGVSKGTTVTISNRDANLTAIGGTFVVAIKMGTEYRPVWVSC